VQQKLLFEVIIPYSSAVWRFGIKFNYLLCKSTFVLSGRSNSLPSKK